MQCRFFVKLYVYPVMKPNYIIDLWANNYVPCYGEEYLIMELISLPGIFRVIFR